MREIALKNRWQRGTSHASSSRAVRRAFCCTNPRNWRVSTKYVLTVGFASPFTSLNHTMKSRGGFGSTPPKIALADFLTSFFVNGASPVEVSSGESWPSSGVGCRAWANGFVWNLWINPSRGGLMNDKELRQKKPSQKELRQKKLRQQKQTKQRQTRQ